MKKYNHMEIIALCEYYEKIYPKLEEKHAQFLLAELNDLLSESMVILSVNVKSGFLIPSVNNLQNG